ncbi:MAG: hypothetical protein ACTHJO_14695 [Rhodanobacter sp.]
MHAPSLHALLDALERDAALREPDALRERLDALDRIELLQLGDSPAPNASARRIAALREDFEALNAASFAHAREAIRHGAVPALLQACVDEAEHADGDGYDWRDELVEGVLQLRPPSPAVSPLPADMVAYQPTPARHIFELLAQARLNANDMLVDLGSGLGHVPLLAAICSGAASLGIEREVAYVACAQAGADALGLSRARFLCLDARAADVSRGTLFYLYTPFRGAVLDTVLGALRREAERRALRIAAHGPCVGVLAAQPWLAADTPPRAARVTLFRPRG